MRTNDQVVAICCADIHLSVMPPAARSGEPNWFAAMARPLLQLTHLCDEHPGAVVLCAGDVFHHWRSPPELINFALDALPYLYAIPGQHDLPLHNYADLRKSAYATMVKADRIANVTPGEPYRLTTHANVVLHGFPWGVPIDNSKVVKGKLNIALHHAYRGTTKNTMYNGAPKGAAVKVGEYSGFDVVVIGDNHISWDAHSLHPTLYNCGSLMRRNADQIQHRPRVGLIYADGRVVDHYLDCTADVISAVESAERADAVLGRFEQLVTDFQLLQADALDFPEALRWAMDAEPAGSVPATVRRLVLEAIDNGRK